MSKFPIPILFVDHATNMGGAEHSLHLLMTHLDPGLWQTHLATSNGRFAQTAQSNNIHTHILTFPQLRRSATVASDWWQTTRQIAALSQSLDARILHANTIRASLYTSLAAKLAKRPFVWHMRDFWLSENKPNHLWMDTTGKKLLAATAKTVIANSHATANHLPSSSKIQVVPNGIDLSQFNPSLDKRPFREQYNIPENAPVVGMVGRLRPWKGQVAFLHMAAQIRKTRPECHFVIVGGTPFNVQDDYVQKLEQLTEQLQLKDCVTFTGALNPIQSALAAMDVFVHPGQPEPFGLVNIEAMAMKKPVVAFGHGALPEIVVDGETGFLTTPNDIDAITAAVLTLLQDPPRRKIMGQMGRQRVENFFTIQQTAVQISTIFQGLST